MAEDCSSMELINGDGKINEAGLDCFGKSVKLSERGLSYAVVAIMGPQGSGKSTLLNHLFFTNFVMMDSCKGRSQTTKGIWMAKAANFEPLTIILDMEGNDGQERGEDVAFEKQSALFALALADIVLINMWHSDMGRENGANKPLLKTVFEAMTKLFPPRKTTLLFIIRDTDMDTPVTTIESDLKNIIQKIWENVPKPEDRQNAALDDFFIVKVNALCHFKHQTEQFKDEVAKLREQFNNSIAPGGLAGDGKERVPGSGFSLSAQHIWKVIKDNKDLNLPAQKVMVATVRCEEIANETACHLREYEGWLALEGAVKSGPVLHFGKQLNSILNTHLSKYDKEAMYFDEGVRDAKRLQLESKMLEHVRPTYETLLSHLRSQAKERFKTQLEKALSRGEGFAASVRNFNESCLLEFDKQCKDAAVKRATDWDATNFRQELTLDIKELSVFVAGEKLTEIVACHKTKLLETIEGANIESLLIKVNRNGPYGDWPSIRQLYIRELDNAVSEFFSSISGFDVDDSTFKHLLRSLRKYAKSLVVKKAREEKGKVLYHMKERFTNVFRYDQDSKPRLWTGEEDLNKITQDAHSMCLKILSAMTVIRLEERSDNIEKILFSSLMNQSTSDFFCDGDPLAMSVWKEVSLADTIITPIECKSLWIRFLEETEVFITQATNFQELTRENKIAKAHAAQAKADVAAAEPRAEGAEFIAKAKATEARARAEAEARARAEAEARARAEAEGKARAEAEARARDQAAAEAKASAQAADKNAFNASSEDYAKAKAKAKAERRRSHPILVILGFLGKIILGSICDFILVNIFN